MNRVLMNRLRDLRREEQAEKRRADRDAISLNEPLGTDDDNRRSLSLADLLADDDADGQPEEAAERAERREAIDRVRSRLPPRQLGLVDGFLAERSIGELSRLLGTPRTTLHDEFERIKAEFRAEGLDEFID